MTVLNIDDLRRQAKRTLPVLLSVIWRVGPMMNKRYRIIAVFSAAGALFPLC